MNNNEITNTHKCTKCEITITTKHKVCEACLARQRMYVIAVNHRGIMSNLDPDESISFKKAQTIYHALKGTYYIPRIVKEASQVEVVKSIEPQTPITKPYVRIIHSITHDTDSGNIQLRDSRDIVIATITQDGNILTYNSPKLQINGIPSDQYPLMVTKMTAIKNILLDTTGGFNNGRT